MATLSRVTSLEQPHKSVLLAALSDPNFDENKSTHCQKIAARWKAEGRLTEQFGGDKLWEPAVRKALEGWRDSHGDIPGTRIRERLSEILHQDGIKSFHLSILLKDAIAWTIEEQQRTPGSLDDDHVCCLLVWAVCRWKPVLPFWSRDSKDADHKDKLGNTSPVEEAIGDYRKPGLPHVVRLLLHRLKQHCDKDQTLFYSTLPESQPGFNMLCAAIDVLNLELVQVILDLCDGLTRPPHDIKVLDKLIEKGKNETRDRLTKLSEIIKLVLKTQPNLASHGALELAVDTGRREIVEPFFRPDLLSLESATKVILHNNLEIWNITGFKEACKGLHESYLLHLAVKNCCVEMVKYLAKETSGVTVTDKDGKYALYYNNLEDQPPGRSRQVSRSPSSVRPNTAGASPERRSNSTSLLAPPTTSRGRAASESAAPEPVLRVHSNPEGLASGVPVLVANEEEEKKEKKRREERVVIRRVLIEQIVRRCEPGIIYEIVQASKGMIVNPM
jgi:hypothetical protein